MNKTDYYVYAFELNDEPNYVYLGQSYLPPAERRLQHINGPHKARSIKYCTIGKLRPDLYESLNPLATREEALEKEAWLASELAGKGFQVEGGH